MTKNATGKPNNNDNSGYYLAFFLILFFTLLPIALFAGR